MAMNFGRVAASLAGGVIAGAGQGLIEEAKQLHDDRRRELDRQFRREERVEEQTFRAGERDLDRKQSSEERELDRGERREDRSQRAQDSEADRALREQDRIQRAKDAAADRGERAADRGQRAKDAEENRNYYERRDLAANNRGGQIFVGKDGFAYRVTPNGTTVPVTDPETGRQIEGYPTGAPRTAAARETQGLSADDDRLLKRLEESHSSLDGGVDRKAIADQLEQMGRDDLVKLYDPSRGGAGTLRGFGNLDAGAAAGRDAGVGSAVGTDNRKTDIQTRDRARTEGTQRVVNPVAPGGRTPPAQYPDARWSERENGWVVQRNGKWHVIEE